MLKGYYVPNGYMGWIPDGKSRNSGHYCLFASESDYLEYVKEDEE